MSLSDLLSTWPRIPCCRHGSRRRWGIFALQPEGCSKASSRCPSGRPVSSMPTPHFSAKGGASVAYFNRKKSARALLSVQNPGIAHLFSELSVKASRPWKILRLLMYWISPCLKLSPSECFSARKWSVSRASACASVMGGMFSDRGRPRNPVKRRRAYWMMTLSGAVFVAGRWNRGERRV